MGAGGFVQVFSSDVATVVCQTESEHSLCFSYIYHFAFVFFANYSIYNVERIAIELFAKLPFFVVNFYAFAFFYEGAANASFHTFSFPSPISFFGAVWQFGSY